MAGTSGAARQLNNQLKQMQKASDLPGISCGLVDDDIFEWEVTLMISDDCRFYGGGIFVARLSFPQDYPHNPPKMKFESEMFHPNSKFTMPALSAYASSFMEVYEDGTVCISILHPPEDDKYGYETAAERWSPVQTPETILISVISMLSSPNDESPANIDAAKLWRDDPKEFRKRCRKCVRISLHDE